jgi:ABC-2 type transport system ATP-binding protein
MLELDDLSHRFGDVRALDHLSFTVPEGAMYGFVGPNGAGKTTAMRAILGIVRPQGGAVRWRGRPIDAAMRRRFGYMPEERGLYPKMRVGAQLAYLGHLLGLDRTAARQRTADLLERLGLAERAGDRVEELSLGNQQRVQLAAALVHDPELLILDEPFSGLDPVGVDVLSEVLVDRTRAGVAVVFSSHQLELVERLCTAVTIISRGAAVASGGVGDLRDSHGGRRLRVAVEGGSTAWVDGLPGVAVTGKDDGSVLLDLAEGADDQAVLAAAAAAGRVTHFGIERPTLAELFREVVR